MSQVFGQEEWRKKNKIFGKTIVYWLRKYCSRISLIRFVVRLIFEPRRCLRSLITRRGTVLSFHVRVQYGSWFKFDRYSIRSAKKRRDIFMRKTDFEIKAKLFFSRHEQNWLITHRWEHRYFFFFFFINTPIYAFIAVNKLRLVSKNI